MRGGSKSVVIAADASATLRLVAGVDDIAAADAHDVVLSLMLASLPILRHKAFTLLCHLRPGATRCYAIAAYC